MIQWSYFDTFFESFWLKSRKTWVKSESKG